LPEIKVPEIEATYLAWLDCRELYLQNPANLAEVQEKLFVSPGSAFGDPQAVRFNYGCSTARVQEGLEKLVRALSQKEG
jgi:cystathionine beta-lyase